ncbi:MAG: tetratricopeptide repeat protein [Myxococcota bacterium]|nr:tetratricopeptide repeat protein [Myxococcota bacterium]
MSDRRLRTLPLLLLLLLGLWAASACGGSDEADRAARERYRAAVAEQDVARAREAVDALDAALPETPEATIELARLLAQVGETNRARWLLEAALERSPGREDLVLGLAETSLLVGDGTGALRALEAVEPRSPRYPYARLLHARAQILLGDLEGGLATLEEGEARFPDTEIFRLERIEVLHTEKEFEPALALVRETRARDDLPDGLDTKLALREADLAGAVEGSGVALLLLEGLRAEDPTSIELLRRRAALLVAEGRGDAARAELEAAARAAPERGDLWALLAHVRLAEGDADGAEEAMREQVARDPGPGAAMNLARFLHDVGRAREGAAVLAAASDAPESPERLELRYLRVAMLIEARDLAEARSAFAAFRARHPGNPRVAYLEARFQLAGGEPRAAARTLTQVLPRLDRADVQHLLALALERSGDVAGAEQRFGLAVSRNNEQIPSWLGLLRMLETQGKWEALAESATTLIRLAPGRTEGFDALARAHLALGEPERAEAVLREHCKRVPHLAGPRVALSLSLRRQGRDRDALAALDAAGTQLRADPRLRAERAVVLGRLGRFDEARAELAAADEPDATPELRHARIYLLLADGRAAEALAAVDREAAREPDDPTALVMAGDFLSSRRDFARAVGHYRRARERAPADARLAFRLGIALDAAGDPDGAVAAYRAAIALDEDAVGPRNNLALVLGRQGATREALEAAQAAYGLAPSDPVVMDTLGALYLEAGLAERAAALLEKARRLAPEAPDVLFHLALAYRATGRDAEAREILHDLHGRLAPGDDLRGPVGEALASLR